MVMVFVKITSKGNTGTNDSAMYQTAGEKGENDGEGRGRGTWFLSLYISSQKGKIGGLSDPSLQGTRKH